MKPPVFRISRQKEWIFTGTGKNLVDDVKRKIE